MGNLECVCGHYWRGVFNGVSLRANRSRNRSKCSAMGSMLILMLCTYLAIFCVALKSKLYYKGDDRVSTFVANTFVVAGAIGCVPIFIAVLLRIPFLGEGILWVVDSIFSGGDPLVIILPAIWIVGILSIVSGIGYAVCLKNFRE